MVPPSGYLRTADEDSYDRPATRLPSGPVVSDCETWPLLHCAWPGLGTIALSIVAYALIKWATGRL
jgi:hypothetical protein